MSSIKEFEDLSVEDRAKVISGLIIAGVMIVSFLVFTLVITYYFHISDRLKSGSSFFSLVSLFLLLMYVFTLLPTICVGVTILGILLKRSPSSVFKGVLTVLLMFGAGVLLLASVFALFALTLSNISVYVQLPLSILTIFVYGIAVTSVFKTRKVSGYFKKILS